MGLQVVQIILYVQVGVIDGSLLTEQTRMLTRVIHLHANHFTWTVDLLRCPDLGKDLVNSHISAPCITYVLMDGLPCDQLLGSSLISLTF